ncbi:hypothetical protein YTPLAS18_22730 [Nitrospira sp.]|nr:hypothetical protein YTPLAS18_22730 [Nitrospira sp.]
MHRNDTVFGPLGCPAVGMGTTIGHAPYGSGIASKTGSNLPGASRSTDRWNWMNEERILHNRRGRPD